MGYNRNKTTNMEISKYVFHSIDDLNDGCCVLVGDLIITAGHVISDHALKIVVEGATYHLSKDEALYYKWDKDNMDEYSSDIAMFKMPTLSSPIQLETSYPCEGMTLKSISYEHVVEKADDSHTLFGGKFATKDYIRPIECNAIISAVEGNFFLCKTDIVLKPGSSGSPVFKDGKVLGILHGGQPDQPFCAFQSSASILDILKEIKYYPTLND